MAQSGGHDGYPSTPVDYGHRDSFRICRAGSALTHDRCAGLHGRRSKHRPLSPSRQQWHIVAAAARPVCCQPACTNTRAAGVTSSGSHGLSLGPAASVAHQEVEGHLDTLRRGPLRPPSGRGPQAPPLPNAPLRQPPGPQREHSHSHSAPSVRPLSEGGQEGPETPATGGQERRQASGPLAWGLLWLREPFALMPEGDNCPQPYPTGASRSLC